MSNRNAVFRKKIYMRKIWNIRQKDKKKAAGLAAELGVSTLLAGILLNRGIDSAAAARDFLHPEARG